MQPGGHRVALPAPAANDDRRREDPIHPWIAASTVRPPA